MCLKGEGRKGSCHRRRNERRGKKRSEKERGRWNRSNSNMLRRRHTRYDLKEHTHQKGFDTNSYYKRTSSTHF